MRKVRYVSRCFCIRGIQKYDNTLLSRLCLKVYLDPLSEHHTTHPSLPFERFSSQIANISPDYRQNHVATMHISILVFALALATLGASAPTLATRSQVKCRRSSLTIPLLERQDADIST